MLTKERIAYIKTAIAHAATMDCSNARYFYRSASDALQRAQHDTNQKQWLELFVQLETIASSRGL